MLTFVGAEEALTQWITHLGLLKSSLHHASSSAVQFHQMFILWSVTANILDSWWYTSGVKTLPNDKTDKLKEKYSHLSFYVQPSSLSSYAVCTLIYRNESQRSCYWSGKYLRISVGQKWGWGTRAAITFQTCRVTALADADIEVTSYVTVCIPCRHIYCYKECNWEYQIHAMQVLGMALY